MDTSSSMKLARMQGTFWMPEDDQAHWRTEHDKDTCFRTVSRRKF
ncbi:hypothetical protein HanXRQr2_Chr16g0756121 [Helianthus annuus]|uniref:Uncharacterized protein n=1 Tax=Helianthus annuus TaxID=4232 RepID=A0A9K3DTS3_HELAN|nr:hypothetical protein HanXRQr2_Chr16g0756121 [Helianthus annuus]KAJ0821818.1 hypothetical protein HanPSC8_Chr16g0724651 [Helianthus annuus]